MTCLIRIAVVCVVLISGCSKEKIPVQWPNELPGGFELKSATEAAADVQVMDYGPLKVTSHRTGANASAFEMLQKWKRGPGTWAFHRGEYFVVLESTGTDAKTFAEIAAALESKLP
jgi:hypothetical protein